MPTHGLGCTRENNLLGETLLQFFYNAEPSVKQYKYFAMGIFSCCENVVPEL